MNDVMSDKLTSQFVPSGFVEAVKCRTLSDDWDSFAALSNGCVHGLKGWLPVVAMRRLGVIRRFNLMLIRDPSEPKKIGQCAIALTMGRAFFVDGIHLRPGYEPYWHRCMEAVLALNLHRLYRYGTSLSVERSRISDFGALSNVTVTNVVNRCVDGVDFSQWPDWDHYVKAISSNVRRNVKRFRNEHPDADFEVKRGREAFALARELARCKRTMLSRKNASLRYRLRTRAQLLRLMLIPRHAFCAVIRAKGGEVLAAFGGVELGRNMYYFDGGSLDKDGSGWALKMMVMEEFFRRHPDGRVLMNHRIVTSAEVQPVATRYIRDARATYFPTSIISFKTAAG